LEKTFSLIAKPNIRFISVFVSPVILLLSNESSDRLYMRVDQASITGDAFEFDPNDEINSLIFYYLTIISTKLYI
jgi:hypothetical protein